MEIVKEHVLEEILNEKQIHHILKRCIGDDIPWEFKSGDVKPATVGLTGFLGDHLKATLSVKVEGELKEVHLFIKRIPPSNKPKADFIETNHYFKREMLMFQVLEEICDDDLNPWSVKAYIYTNSLIVMPDLTYQGYKQRNYIESLDLDHIFVTTKSIACFHAAIVNYETKKSIDLGHSYNTYQEFGDILTEPTLCDSLWLKASSKLSANIIKAFSSEGYSCITDLEPKLTELYLKACDSLMEYKNTINVLIHKDLWVNNIMYKYISNVPISAVLIDFQLLRYSPPVYDLMSFLYLTTDRDLRKKHEMKIFDYYYKMFNKNLSVASKNKLKNIGYDKDNFLMWCEKARLFGMFAAAVFYPYVLMDPKTAQETFDNPETYVKYVFEDRSEPVIAHAMKCEAYKRRNLEVTEELIEKYLLKHV